MSSLRAGALVLALLLPMVAGCFEDAPDLAAEQSTVTPVADPVVVALVDSGITPYHDAFRAAPGKGAEVFAEAFGAEVVTLTQEGNLGARLEADAAIWESLEPGKLYAFAGTRVLAISISQTNKDIPPVLDGHDHGTATAGLVLREAPDALVVMVQIDVSIEFTRCPPECPYVVSLAPTLEWIADQPWIDGVSMSVGYLGNTPETRALNPDAAPALEASRKVAESGKFIVAAAGNDMSPTFASYVCGPPWIITVGGAGAKTRGETLVASKGVDVLANYTDWTVDSGTIDGMHEASGTSYAAPIVAGTLAHALGIVEATRGVDPETPARLRTALNQAAIHFSVPEWKPRERDSNDSGINHRITIPVLVPAQQGWGYVDGSIATEIARRVLEDDLAIPPEKAQTAAYMAQWQSLRERYWENAP